MRGESPLTINCGIVINFSYFHIFGPTAGVGIHYVDSQSWVTLPHIRQRYQL